MVEEATLHELLDDLHKHGAEEPNRLCVRVGGETLTSLIAGGYLALHPTPAGELIILGPQGRRALGLHPYYKSSPEAAATQLMRRWARERLEREGWIYQGKQSRNLDVFTSQQGERAYLLVRWGGHRARSVRRVLANHRSRLILEGSHLRVATPHPHFLKRLAARSDGLVRLLKL